MPDRCHVPPPPSTAVLVNPRDVTAVRAWLTANAPDVPAVASWAARVQADAATVGPVPAVGTPAWCGLPDHDPRKVAAVLAPALARLWENTPAAVALRMGRELRDLDRAAMAQVRAASHAVAGAHDWHAASYRPRWATLDRRRWAHPCPDCRVSLPWLATQCECGWRQPTPDQIRAHTAASWAPLAPDKAA